MISPDRLLPQSQIYNFLRTVTIKYEPVAQYVNQTLAQNGYAVNDQDPTTWKYYLNMIGQYHESDTPMYVTSLDTRERVLFSPEIFVTNPRTRSAYSPGGTYYNRLCETYPEQVDLIKSILFPVDDITKAINAPDLSLLGWGSGYLETYEESIFIQQIEDFLLILKERWYFDFLDDEPYFYLTFWSSIPIYLAMLLMSGRMANIKTPYAHSWDIWNELGGHGLDNYSDILDREKSMMLYQNIDYFKANAGKQSNLLILAERLLTSLGIGLYGRIVVQESQSGADDYQLTPQLVPVRLPASTEALPAQIEIKTVTTIMSEIYQKGLTPSEQQEAVNTVERKLGDTTLNEFATKFLEIRPIAKNKPYAELLNMFLMETLVVSIKEGYYTQPAEVVDPLTKSPIYLLPAELLALYNYAVLKSLGLSVAEFPNSVRLYRSFLPTIGTPVKNFPWRGQTIYISQQVDADSFLADLDYAQHLQSPQEFTDNATALWLRFMSHLLLDQNTLMTKRHVIYEYLATMCHKRREEPIQLVANHATYESWLGPNGIDIQASILTQYDIQSDASTQWSNLADTILTVLLPINDTLISFGNFTLSDAGYARLRQLFIQMCSYRVVFLESGRNTSEFAIGAKWSSQYGPDHIQTFADLIDALQIQTIDTTHVHADLTLYPRRVTSLHTHMDSHVDYTLTTTSTTKSTAMDQRADRIGTGIIATGATITQGAINLNYSQTIPVMPSS